MHIPSRFMVLSFVGFALLTLAAIACGEDRPHGISSTVEVTRDPATSPDRDSSIAIADVEREVAPEVLPSDLQELARGNNQFAFDLYDAIKGDSDGNLFYSPFSISIALAMTYAGAEGETDRQMADTLHFTLPEELLHPAFNTLDQRLSSEGEFTLRTANSLWGQQGFPWREDFVELLARNYGTGMRMVDYKTSEASREAARQAINKWVEDETQDKIKDLIPRDVIDTLTRLVLVNAIFFDAEWKHRFPNQATDDEPFHLLDGSTVPVPMMELANEQEFRYTRGNRFQAIELPYKGSDISMLLVVPDKGEFEAVEDGLNAEFVRGVITDLEDRPVLLKMPKFEFSAKFKLKPALEKLGMPIAFADGFADFSGMAHVEQVGGRLVLEDVVHEGVVKVDERGTEAAAATGVVVRLESGPPPDLVELTIDRPFIFTIFDNETETTLFAGRVMDPTAGEGAS